MICDCDCGCGCENPAVTDEGVCVLCANGDHIEYDEDYEDLLDDDDPDPGDVDDEEARER